MLPPKNSTKTEWQSGLHILACKFKSSYAWKEMKRNVLLSRLWSDHSIKKLIHLWLQEHHIEKQTKSIVKARKFKAAGNEAFRAKDYSTSIKCYTNCISYAPANSKELSLGIANRSAALFYLGRYNDCIKDIEFAIKSHYPKEMRYKVLLRALQCHIRLGEKDLAVGISSKLEEIIHDRDYVSSTEEAKILERMKEKVQQTKPAIINLTEMNNQLLEAKSQIVFQDKSIFPYASITINKKYNKTSGWHVVANTFIKQDDILFVEKPVSFVLLNQDALDGLCQHCNSSTRDTPVSCSVCTRTFYCSETCLIEATCAYHRWECPGSQMEIWEKIGIGHLALKVFLVCSTTTDKTKVNEMQRLITNFDKLPIDDIIAYGITAAMLTTYLSEYTDFFETINLEDCSMKEHLDKFHISNFNTSADNMKQLYVSHLLLQYILKLIANGHAITRTDSIIPRDDSAMIKQDIVATGIYPSASTMNHSCEPNIINIFVDQYLIVKASRDIVKGEEIFNCYGTVKLIKEKRFDAMKNPKWYGAFYPIEISLVCTDCTNTSEIYIPTEIVKVKQIFDAVQVSLELTKYKKH